MTAASEIYHSSETAHSAPIMAGVWQNSQVNMSTLPGACVSLAEDDSRSGQDSEHRRRKRDMESSCYRLHLTEHAHPDFFFRTTYQAPCFSCEPALIGVIVRRHNNSASGATYSNNPSSPVSTFHNSATLTSHRTRTDNTFNKSSVCLRLMEHGRKQMWATTDL